jgi:hypothetical protein
MKRALERAMALAAGPEVAGIRTPPERLVLVGLLVLAEAVEDGVTRICTRLESLEESIRVSR